MTRLSHGDRTRETLCNARSIPFNLAGEILGSLTLPASFRLADLAALKTLGAARVEVLS